MPKDAKDYEIQVTLMNLVKPRMSPKELLRETKKAHPNATKREIVRAAFASIIAYADSDVDKALILHDFALKERSSDDVA
jgi:hypothetical protein